MTERRFWLIFVLILLAAFMLRTVAIETRPLHSDEGVNYHFLQEIDRTGIYPYSHENYHGPAYFFLSKAATDILGDSVFALRFAAILSGTLLLLVLVPLRRILGRSFVLAGAAFLALSPSLVFFSRYGIHEMLFLLGSAWFMIDLYFLLQHCEKKRIYTSAIALSVMISTKETFTIMVAACCLAGLLVLLLTKSQLRDKLDFLRRNGIHFYAASMLAVFLIYACYSSGFRSATGIRELFFALQQWFQRGTSSDVGHFKPFSYYMFSVFRPTEPYMLALYPTIVVLLFGSLLWALVQRKEPDSPALLFSIYSTVVAWVMFLAYSWVPYKTVWLVINITFPALLALTAWMAFFALQSGFLRLFASVLTLALLAVMSVKTYYYNYPANLLPFLQAKRTVPYGPENPFSYVHTSPGMMELLADIENYSRRNPQARVLVGVQSYWPLPYYLRSKKGQDGYFIPEDPSTSAEEYDIIIIDSHKPWYQRGRPWPSKYYRLSDVQEANAYFKPLD